MSRLRALFVAGLLASRIAQAGSNSLAEARVLYAKGKAAYKQSSYDEAIAFFERAYRISHAPALLFNMAQAHRLAGPEHCEQALQLYQHYLEKQPNASNHDEAVERVGEMRACVEQRVTAGQHSKDVRTESLDSESSGDRGAAPPHAPAEPTKADTAPRPTMTGPNGVAVRSKPAVVHSRNPAAAIMLTGFGASVTVAGAILYARARAKYDEAKSSCPCPAGSYSGWQTLSLVSYGLLAAGAAGTAGGISWLLLGGDGATPKLQGLYVQTRLHF